MRGLSGVDAIERFFVGMAIAGFIGLFVTLSGFLG
jgi:hypothetical protein